MDANQMLSSSKYTISTTMGSTPAIGQSIKLDFLSYITLTVSMALLGTVGNILVLGALCVHKRLRVLGNVFIANLAIADLFVSAMINPFSLIGVFDGGVFFLKYPWVCEIIGTLCTLVCSCSIWSIASISMNRYIAICHRLTYPKIYNRNTLPVILLATWCLCFSIDLPTYLKWSNHEFNTKVNFCTWDYTGNHGYSLYVISLGFYVPMCLTSYSYVRIFLFSRKTKRRLKNILPSDVCPRSRIRTTDMRLLKSVGSIWIMFMLMWSPFATVVIFDSGSWSDWFLVVAVALAHTNSCVNSCLYAATNKNFREGYVLFMKRVYRCSCCCLSDDVGNKRKTDIAMVSCSTDCTPEGRL